MRLGARIIKTGVAIVLALFIAELLQLPQTVFAGIAAVFAIQPSIYRSYLRIVEQVQGNVIGAVIAITFVLIFGHQLVVIGLAAVIIILIMNKLKLEASISMALVMMIAIMEIQNDEFLTYAILRFATFFVGVFAAFLVNLLFLPPKYETKLFHSINQTQDEIIRWSRIAGRQTSDHISTKKALKTINERLATIDQTFLLYKEERGYFKKTSRAKARKLVAYRQMIAASKRSYEVLQRMHKFENELIDLPEQFRLMVQERLDSLLTYHEQLHLKFVGKLKAENMSSDTNEDYIQRHEVLEIFVKEIALTKEEEEFSSYHLLHVLSAILNYEEQLEHLDKLIVSIHKHHKVNINVSFNGESY